MILLQNIDKKIKDDYILKNFSLHIKKGEFLAITGKSGAGKTTLLNLMGLIDIPDNGDVIIKNIKNPSKKETVLLKRNDFGYIFQNYLLLDNETVQANLLISKAYNKSINKNDLLNSLETVGLDKTYLNKKVYQLSGGEQQKVAIARIILKNFTIILADEPTGNLDHTNKNHILDLFIKLKKDGKTIVCVTHDESIAQKADRIIKIEKGEKNEEHHNRDN